jgi:hypothetical protein
VPVFCGALRSWPAPIAAAAAVFMAALARAATAAAHSWSKNTAFAPHAKEQGFASRICRQLTQAILAMKEQVNIEKLREETGKRVQAFIERQRKLVRTIDAALVILAAFAAICFFVWLL